MLKKAAKFMNLYNSYVVSCFFARTPFVRMIPSDKCNLKCKYCWQRREESYEMTMEEFERHLAKAKKLNVGIITFLGGEPMAWPLIFDAIQKCTDKNVLTDMTTNGTLLDDKTIQQLGTAGLDYLNISVDGMNPSVVTAKNSIFRKDILHLLKEAKKRFRMHFRINSVIYKNNFEEIKAMINFAKDQNIQISLGYIVEPLAKQQNEGSGIHFRLEDKQLLDEIIDYIVNKKRQGYPIIDPEEYFKNVYKYLRGEKFWNCNYPTKYGWVNISPDGRIRSCTKKMDELDLRYDELDINMIKNLREVLAQKTAVCNVHCYSNCAYDSFYYTHHKFQMLKKVLNRIRLK
ncbi:MAG: radical SAM protein [Phycisphaerales bacterium]